MAETPYLIVAGYAQLPQNTGAGVMHRHLTIIVRVEVETRRIKDVSTTLATRVADDFVREVMLGRDLVVDAPSIIAAVSTQYRGNGMKAIIGAFRDLVARFEESAPTDG